MTRLIGAILIAATAVAGAGVAGLTLDEVIQAAGDRPSPEDFEVVIAEGRAQLLEAMGRRRIGLSPQMGLLAAASPLSALANLGTSLLLKQGSVPPALVLDAQVDMLSMQLAKQRRDVQREIDVTTRYYSLAEAQLASDHVCEDVQEDYRKRATLLRDLSRGRITQAELIRHDLGALDRESACVNAEERRRIAAGQLLPWVNQPVELIRASTNLPAISNGQFQLGETVHLVRVAMANRTESRQWRASVAALKAEAQELRPSSAIKMMAGAGQGFSREATDAGKKLVLGKLNKIELEMNNWEAQLKRQIDEIKARFETQRSQLVIAQKRQRLYEQQAEAVAARHQAGLEPASVLEAAEAEVAKSSAMLARIDSESRMTLGTLISVCGVRAEPAARQLALLSDRSPMLRSSLQ